MELNAESTGPVDSTEVDSEVNATEAAGSAPAATESGESGKETSDWTKKAQERYDTLTRERYEAAARADRAEYRLQEAERRLAERQEAEAKTETVAPSDEYPTLESVGYDEGKHATAVANWAAKQAREAAKAEIAHERTAAQRDQLERDWERKQDAFIKSKPDYADKVGRLSPSLMTDALAAEIKEMGNPEIAYYLGENLEKLAEIARLPPKAQARELGRIEARLEAAKVTPPPVSKAPPPPGRVDGSEVPASVDTTNPESDGLSDEAWFKAEQRRLKNLRNRNG